MIAPRCARSGPIDTNTPIKTAATARGTTWSTLVREWIERGSPTAHSAAR
jgi:hypothetical protein